MGHYSSAEREELTRLRREHRRLKDQPIEALKSERVPSTNCPPR